MQMLILMKVLSSLLEIQLVQRILAQGGSRFHVAQVALLALVIKYLNSLFDAMAAMTPCRPVQKEG